MPPKSKKASAAEKAKDVQETEDPLQAVVLADSFETRFRPFTRDTPRCLLALANTPLIEYTLEFLANSGVEEVYVYCGAHTEKIEAYLQSTKWTTPTSPFTLHILHSTSTTIGDAMRDLDKRELLTNDFLILYGDVVSNISIEPALREHQARRATDKNAIMTMVLGLGDDRTHQNARLSPVFMIDPTKQRCLQYEQISAHDDPHALLLDADILTFGAAEIEIRHDLIDPGIDICTPDVLALWQDNFDYEAPRRGFLHSVLKDYELNGKTIHTFVERGGYVNRVRDLGSYGRVSGDVVGRRTWPMCPDGTFGDEFACRMQQGGVLREKDVKVAKSARVGKRSVLGAKSVIGAGTRVERSVVGRNCRVGEDCDIEGAYLWDDAVIEDGVHIQNAIIGTGAVVGSKSKVVEGTLISQGIRIPSGTTTKPRQRLVKKDKATPDDPPQDYDPSSSEDEDTQLSLLPSLNRTTSSDSISTLTSSRSASPLPDHHRTTSVTSTGSMPSDDLSRTTSTSDPSSSDFHREASTSILDALIKNDDPANIQIELQGLRMSANASEHAVRKAVVAGLVGYVLQQRSSGTKSSIKQILERNGDLLKRVVYDYDAEGEKPDQVDLLLCVQRELVGRKDAETVMLSICNALYGDDLVEGEGIVQWWDDERGTQSEGLRAVRGHKDMEKLIEIAREESDEEESDEDEDEESD